MKKTRLFIFMLVFACMLPLLLGGCEKYDPAVLQQYAAQADAMTAQIEALQASIAPALQEQLAGGLITPEQAAKVEKVNDEINRIKPQLAAITSAIKQIEYTGEAAEDTITTLQAINSATSTFNPWSALIAAILTATGFVVKIVQQSKVITQTTAKAQKAETAVAEIVSGIEQAKKATPDTSALKAAMNAAQSVDTQKTVATIRKELAA